MTFPAIHQCPTLLIRFIYAGMNCQSLRFAISTNSCRKTLWCVGQQLLPKHHGSRVPTFSNTPDSAPLPNGTPTPGASIIVPRTVIAHTQLAFCASLLSTQ